jgi:hypothetical protein
LKKLVKYIASFIREDFHPFVYGIAFIILIAAISFNYTVSFEKKVLDHYYRRPPLGMIYYFLFYSIAYYFTAVPKLFIQSSRHILNDKRFWLKSLMFLLMLGIIGGFCFIDDWAKQFKGFEYFYIAKLGANLRFLIVFVLPLFVLWKFADKEMPNMYGFTFKNFDVKPYIIMLLLMVPLVIAASTQSDFLATYPKFKPWFPQGNVFDLSRFQMTSIYEFTYGLNFISLELFFRGAMVIGMIAIMGKHAVLPMAVTYCFLHFGKPMAECISSFFGGYLLGIIAMYTKSIFGGCIVHLGIAWLMEIAAMAQHYLFYKS